MEDYQNEFKEFIEKLNKDVGAVDPSEVGVMISRMVQYFCDYNSMKTVSSNRLRQASTPIILGNDDNGKPISMAKAQFIIDALPESEDHSIKKMHLENLEQIVNGLKSTLKGLSNEYNHMGNN